MKKRNIALRVIGVLLIVAGIVLAIIGFGAFANTDLDDRLDLFKLAMIGIPMLGVGGMLTMLSFKDAVMRKGMQRRNELIAQFSVACPHCGAMNQQGAAFCNMCGNAIK